MKLQRVGHDSSDLASTHAHRRVKFGRKKIFLIKEVGFYKRKAIEERVSYFSF